MGTQTKTQTYKVDWVAIIVSVVILAALVVGTIASPEKLVSGLDSVKHFLIYNFGSVVLIFCAFAQMIQFKFNHDSGGRRNENSGHQRRQLLT